MTRRSSIFTLVSIDYVRVNNVIWDDDDIKIIEARKIKNRNFKPSLLGTVIVTDRWGDNLVYHRYECMRRDVLRLGEPLKLRGPTRPISADEHYIDVVWMNGAEAEIYGTIKAVRSSTTRILFSKPATLILFDNECVEIGIPQQSLFRYPSLPFPVPVDSDLTIEVDLWDHFSSVKQIALGRVHFTPKFGRHMRDIGGVRVSITCDQNNSFTGLSVCLFPYSNNCFSFDDYRDCVLLR